MSRSTNNYSKVKPYDIIFDKKKDRPPYFKYPRIKINRGPSYKLKSLKIPLPPKPLVEKYQKHSEPFKDKIMSIMEDRAKKIQYGKMKKKEYSIPEIIEEVLGDVSYYETKRSKPGDVILDDTAIRYTYHIPAELSKFIKSRCEKLIFDESKKKARGGGVVDKKRGD